MTGSTRSSDGLDFRRKRALFRCWHRGTREMDLILGRFADAEIAGLTDRELDALERLIEVPDPDLYGTCRADVRSPEAFSCGGSRRVKPSVKSPAELLAPGRVLTLANVAEG